jgi:hypothetical protein
MYLHVEKNVYLGPKHDSVTSQYGIAVEIHAQEASNDAR